MPAAISTVISDAIPGVTLRPALASRTACCARSRVRKGCLRVPRALLLPVGETAMMVASAADFCAGRYRLAGMLQGGEIPFRIFPLSK